MTTGVTIVSLALSSSRQTTNNLLAGLHIKSNMPRRGSDWARLEKFTEQTNNGLSTFRLIERLSASKLSVSLFSLRYSRFRLWLFAVLSDLQSFSSDNLSPSLWHCERQSCPLYTSCLPDCSLWTGRVLPAGLSPCLCTGLAGPGLLCGKLW